MYNGICGEAAGALICASQAPSQKRPLMKPPAHSHSLCDSAGVTVRWMLDRVSTSSFLPAQPGERSTRPARAPHPQCPAAGAPHAQYRTTVPAETPGSRVRRLRRARVDVDDQRGRVRGDRERLDAVDDNADRARTFICRVLMIDGLLRRM